MKKNFYRILGALLSLAALHYAGVLGCSSNDQSLLEFPSIVAIDSANNRVFVIDNQRGGIYLVNPQTNKVQDNGPLLASPPPEVLPVFPSNGVVNDMGNGLSRIFVVGLNDAGPQNQVVVLDFDDAGGIRGASYNPIQVNAAGTDVLVGLAVDPGAGLLFVTDSTANQLHAYNISDGSEVANSPISITDSPGRMSFDATSGLLAVSSLQSNSVSFIDPTNLAAAPITLDVGMFTRDVAVLSNPSGTILFLSANQQSIAKVFKLDLTNLPASTMIFQIGPPPASGPIPNPNFLTGNLNQVKAGNLTNGQMGGFYTQSTGDLLELDLSSDLNTLNPAITIIGSVSGEGIDTLLNGSGQATEVYFASPGVGVMTIVDPLTNLFVDQIK